jgi:general secretion pathway protein M
MRPLTPRERRLLALGLLVGAIGLVWLVLVGPLVGGFADRAQQRQDLAQTYRRNERLIAALPALRAAAEAQRANAGRFGLAAPSEALAVEALKERLQHLAADQGFAVTAVEDLQADAPAGEIKLRADLTLTLTQLYETVKRLESEDAYVVVDYVSVSADRSLAANRLAPIDVRLELSAAWRPTRAHS